MCELPWLMLYSAPSVDKLKNYLYMGFHFRNGVRNYEMEMGDISDLSSDLGAGFNAGFGRSGPGQAVPEPHW